MVFLNGLIILKDSVSSNHEGGSDIFVHYSSIKSEGFKTLNEGQSVSYEIEQGSKGFHATEVELKN